MEEEASYPLMACFWSWKWKNSIKISIFPIYISTKPLKPRPQIMACTKYNAFWEKLRSRFLKINFTFIVTRGWRKLNSVAFQWNHKIYLSRHYQTPIFLREQLQLPHTHSIKISIFPIYISTKPLKPRPQIMACTKYNAFWEKLRSRFLKINFTFIVTRGWRKLNSVAFQWNHKIYLSRHYQTPIFLREQLQLPHTLFRVVSENKTISQNI